MHVLASVEDDHFGYQFCRERFDALEDSWDVVLGGGAVAAAEELEETETVVPPFRVDGVVCYELAIGWFWWVEGSVRFVGL